MHRAFDIIAGGIIAVCLVAITSTARADTCVTVASRLPILKQPEVARAIVVRDRHAVVLRDPDGKHGVLIETRLHDCALRKRRFLSVRAAMTALRGNA